MDKIQPDMIALDPDFVGALAPEIQLTTAVNENDRLEVPFARLPRLERLRVSGKADETEDAEDEPGGEGEGEGKKTKLTKEERVKRKMRGKNKSLKRSVPHPISSLLRQPHEDLPRH